MAPGIKPDVPGKLGLRGGSVILRDYLTQWRERAPWSEDFQVEQDLVISRALVAMFSDTVLAGALAFRGGTALYKLYLTPPARYSEDIDLVQVAPGPAGPLMDSLRRMLDPCPRRRLIPRTGCTRTSDALDPRYGSDARRGPAG